MPCPGPSPRWNAPAPPERVARGLILEHVIPVGITLAAVEAASTPQEVIAVLRRDLILAVITSQESRQLDALGFNRSHPDPARPWSRYGAARIAMLPRFPG